MSVIKLNAIDSTNDFLKEMSSKSELENFTTVVTKCQTKGKGQMGSVWVSEDGKNLIMSVLVKNVLLDVNKIFYLNIAISLAIVEVLNEYKIPNLTVKWPNDIMSDNKKIAGILIENRIKSDAKIESVVGIGLNVNQNNFIDLPNASSLLLLMNKEFDLDELLEKIIHQIKIKCNLLESSTDTMFEDYISKLFKKEIPSLFEYKNHQFMGIIKGVTKDGKLQVLLENDSIGCYFLKEIKMLY